MGYENCCFFNGAAYAGKSVLVSLPADRYGGIACGENDHNALLPASNMEETLAPAEHLPGLSK